jgi:hypothetical protein
MPFWINLVRSLVTLLLAAAGLCLLAMLVVLPLVLPVWQFPRPTGAYGIGTLSYHWVDFSRAEIFGDAPIARRELVVQVWYPATEVPSYPRAPYMTDADAVTAAFARIHHLPTVLFKHFKQVTTHAMLSVPVARDKLSYPVLLFLEGATGFRQMSTFQVEELVSHGYIVVAIDQPGVAANVVFSDGRQAVGLTVEQFQVTVSPSYRAGKAAPLLNGRPLPGGSIVPYLVDDVGFTLDQLTVLNRADPNGILTGRMDLQQTGAFGLSLGGIVVGEACLRDPRLRACLMMDSPMSTRVVSDGLRQPSMWITRDASSMRLEQQRAGGWPEDEIQAHQSTMRAAYQNLGAAGYFVQIAGLFHSNLTDLPNWLPLASQLNLAGPISGHRAHDIVNAYTLAFFDRHLSGKPTPLLDGAVQKYPEVTLETR